VSDTYRVPRWAPKVSRIKIRQLYEKDAQGIVDQELIDEVAYAFFVRCQSILTVTEASHGRVACPDCGRVIQRQGHDKDEVIECPQCAWRTTWGAYFKSYRRKQLHGGGAVSVFQEYVQRLPRAGSLRDKMLLIDWIVHQCHKALIARHGLTYTRPVAVNLIQGNMTQVMQLLQELAYGPGSVPGTRERRAEWRERVLACIPNREKWLRSSSEREG